MMSFYFLGYHVEWRISKAFGFILQIQREVKL